MPSREVATYCSRVARETNKKARDAPLRRRRVLLLLCNTKMTIGGSTDTPKVLNFDPEGPLQNLADKLFIFG